MHEYTGKIFLFVGGTSSVSIAGLYGANSMPIVSCPRSARAAVDVDASATIATAPRTRGEPRRRRASTMPAPSATSASHVDGDDVDAHDGVYESVPPAPS